MLAGQGIDAATGPARYDLKPCGTPRTRRAVEGLGGRRKVKRFGRKRAYEILERESLHDPVARFVHLGLVLLILANSAVAVMETVPSFDASFHGPLYLFEFVSFLVFLAEYVLRIWAAPEDPR